MRRFTSPSVTARVTACSPGQRLAIPLAASFMTGSRAYGDALTLRTTVTGWDALGRQSTLDEQTRRIPYRPWMTGALDSLVVTAPPGPAVAVVATRLEDAAGSILQRNFTTLVVSGDAPATMRLGDGREARLASVAPSAVSASAWSLKQWTVLDGLKEDGAGAGFFEYTIPWPAGLDPARVASVSFLAEVSAKQLFGKDRDSTMTAEGDYMRGGGFADPSANRNAYPMTDETRFPSAVTVRVNGIPAARWLPHGRPGRLARHPLVARAATRPLPPRSRILRRAPRGGRPPRGARDGCPDGPDRRPPRGGRGAPWRPRRLRPPLRPLPRSTRRSSSSSVHDRTPPRAGASLRPCPRRLHAQTDDPLVQPRPSERRAVRDDARRAARPGLHPHKCDRHGRSRDRLRRHHPLHRYARP